MPPAVHLRPPTPDDRDDFLAAAARSAALHAGLAEPPTSPNAYARYLTRFENDRHVGHLVIDTESNHIAGVINVNGIARGPFQSACLGYFAFTPHAGTGRMTAGLTLALHHAFGPLRLHRLEANIQPHNTPSIALVRRLGFRHEGTSPRFLHIAGDWHDHERFALTTEEWPPA